MEKEHPAIMVLNCEIDLQSFSICFCMLRPCHFFLFCFVLSFLIACFAFNVFAAFQGLMTMPWDVSP